MASEPCLPREHPIAPPTAAQPAPPTARSQRLTTLLMVGRLIDPSGDHLCRVRNLSTGGMMVETTAPLAIGTAVRVELRNLNQVDGKVVWTRNQRAGIQFDTAQEVATLLHAPEDTGQRPRSPRLTASCSILLWHLGHTTAPELRDLSQSGCRLGMAHPLPDGAEVRITGPGLPPRHASQRWTGDGEAGFAFHMLLSFNELSGWERNHAARFSR